ncbi:MAG: hypothetical protein CMJ52_03350 [Planctomycetaceae bacterium]|nr:hypothetical protein [Planctomycetaceae bacterium]
MHLSIRPILAVGFASLLCGVATPATFAQNTDGDLARENERLQARVIDLETALAAALARIAELEKSLATAAATGSASTPVTASKVAPPAKASPAGRIEAIRQAYATAVATAPEPLPTAKTSEADGVRYVRWLKKWIASTNRAFRSRVDWPVRIVDLRPKSSIDQFVTFQPWDVDRDEPVGGTFEIVVPNRAIERARRPRAGDEDPTLLLGGVFIPAIRFDETRFSPGPFDNPPFIGTMAELTWRFDFQGLSSRIRTTEDPPATKP